MVVSDNIFDFGDVDPIDIVESLAEHYKWNFDRIAQDQITMLIEGGWRTYSLSLAWCEFDETLKLICSFDINPPEKKLSNLYEILNLANEKSWRGFFTFSSENNIMIYRYSMNLNGGTEASTNLIDRLVENAITTCERFYPAFQLTCWGQESPQKAMNVAFDEMYGTA